MEMIDGVGPAVICDFRSSQISLTYTDYYSEIRLRYVMGLQTMIQMQCKTLVEKFNVSPLIVGLAGPIWLRLLAHENGQTMSSMNQSLKFKATVTLQKLESLAASIARKIGLALPSVNFHAIASRYLKHLSLPVEKILPQACQVYEWSMPPELYLSDNDSRLPSRVCVMSILIVTMRILYDLNGGKWELIASCSNNLVSAVENGAGECGFNCNARGAVAEDDSADLDPHDKFSKDLHSYLPYCKDVVFTGLGPAYDDHEEKKLREVFGTPIKAAGKASEDGKTNSHTCNNFHHSGFRHGCSSTPKESENFRDDACKCKMSRDDGDSNVTLRQLKADMKENRFVYIPPRKNVKKKDGYIRYARKKDGAYFYAVHADYYILLRSCAKVAQVDVRTMHVGVLAFEKRLEMLERRIDFCLCKRLPDDFCEFCRD
ncbi:hypothetical protein H5410_044918 [Solanum commersonii]|uniref:Rrn7/TAF1B C-terminal cyclin domain-containing protein n=1 Tax=Solanum commersonii TaxID=4109 RepID=A0A9J5XBA0_SOLCO|nr:hypothetical protein H5410_044918 [Solanum commersonii]